MSRGPCRFEIWNAANTSKLADAYQVGDSASVDIVLNDVGNLTLTIGGDEAAAAFAVAGNHVRFYLADQVPFTALIEDPINEVLVDPFDSAKVITLNLRGHIARLEVPIQPFGGLNAKPQSTDRPHKWSSPETDISTWPNPDVRFAQLSQPWSDDPDSDPPWFEPWLPPVGFFDDGAQWLWSRTYDGVNPDPVGESLFIIDVIVANTGLHEMQIAGDDGFDLDVDGIAIGSGQPTPADSFIQGWSYTFEMTAGFHRIGIVGKNYERPVTPAIGTFGGPNVGRIAYVLYDRTTGGAGQVLSDDDVIARSQGDTVCLDYPTSWPAPSDGAIALIHIGEAQTAGAMVGVTASFTDMLTTASTAWADNGALTAQVDDDTTLSILQMMASSERADFGMDPLSFRLDMWNGGELGAPHAATWNTGTGLKHFTEVTQPVVNSYQVRYKTGRFLLEDAGSVATYGLHRKSLKLSDLDEAAARAETQRQLDVTANPTPSYEVELELGAEAVGGSSAPFGAGGVWLGDSPTVNGQQMRMVRCQVSVGADGWPTFKPVFETRQQSLVERQEVRLGKVAGGTLNGRSRAATPVDGLTQAIVGGQCRRADRLTFTHKVWVSVGYDEFLDTSNSLTWEEAVVIQRIKLRQDLQPVDVDTVVEIHKLGPGGDDLIATITLPVGHYKAELVQGMSELPAYTYVSEIEGIYARWTQHDDMSGDPETDTIWATCEVIAAPAHPAAVDAPKVDVPWQ